MWHACGTADPIRRSSGLSPLHARFQVSGRASLLGSTAVRPGSLPYRTLRARTGCSLVANLACVRIPVTPRLILREMTDADLDDIAALLGDEHVMRYYPRPKTRSEARDWIARNQRRYREDGFGLWIMNLRGDGEFVGDCGLTIQHVDGADELEVGYHAKPGMQGRGYATEAAAAVRDFARDVLGAQRLIAIINPLNVPSQRVAANIGLRPEKRAIAPDGSEAVIYAADLRQASPIQSVGRSI
jgi:RimJ/RimL family protein N-acetyltransferase